jgi:hypothetical protein
VVRIQSIQKGSTLVKKGENAPKYTKITFVFYCHLPKSFSNRCLNFEAIIYSLFNVHYAKHMYIVHNLHGMNFYTTDIYSYKFSIILTSAAQIAKFPGKFLDNLLFSTFI